MQVRPEAIASDPIMGNLLARGRLRYLFSMPRLVSYSIHDRDDGLFDAVATLSPDRTYRRAGFTSLAAVEEWIDGLRTLMAAIGAPLVQEQPGPALREASVGETSDTAAAFDPDDAGARLRRFRDAVSAAGDGTD